jgi:ADP-ribosylation factor related protein 1
LNDSLNLDPDANPDGENVSGDNIGGNTARPMRLSDVDGAKAERMASLDVLGVSALTGDGVKDAVTWLYARVRNARRM